MHKFAANTNALATVKAYKWNDKPVKIAELRILDDAEPYYMVTGEGIFGAMSVWEHELRAAE